MKNSSMVGRISGIGFFVILFLLVIDCPKHPLYGQDQQAKKVDINSAESDSAFVHSYLEAADEAKKQGDIRRQRTMLDKAHQVADSLANPQLLQLVEKYLGEYYLETSSYDSAQTVLSRAAERSSDKKIQTQLLNLLATAYRYQSQYPKAMKTYNQALALRDSADNPDISAAINANKAAIYEHLGNRSKAISLYRKGISFAEASGDSSFLATALNNLGNLYNAQSDYDEAQTYLEESMAISQDQNYYNNLLRVTHNLANTQRDLGNYDASRKLFKEAWSLHEKVRPDSPPVQLLFNMGLLHLEVSEFEEAEEHFRESLAYSQKAGVPNGLFHNYIGLGDVALARDDRSAAANFYNDAFEIAEEIDSPPFRINASEKLYQLYTQEGDFEQALKFHEMAKQVSDSLTEAQQDEQLALAETELGLRQQQQINRLLQERQEQQLARITAQNWLIGVSVLVTVIILIFTIILYRSNRERERINRELEELNDVKNKMMGVIAHDLRSPMTSMQGIFYLLKDEELPVEQTRELAAELEISIQQNIDMMDNLLSWASSQMDGLEVNFETISAHDLADEILENSAVAADIKSLRLLNKVDPDLKVKADVNLLKLILRNLLNNAIKFSNKGDSITVTAELKRENVVFKVKDTGIGIPEEDQAEIFSLYGNSRSGTNNESGSGLGLRLCKEFVEKQNGDIYVDSTEGEGATFYVSLPKGEMVEQKN